MFLLLKSFFSVPKVEGESEIVEKGEPAEQEEIIQQPDGMYAQACIQHNDCYKQLVWGLRLLWQFLSEQLIMKKVCFTLPNN